MAADRIEELRAGISADWRVVDGHHLTREIRLKDFRQSLALANRIGEIAESQQHHPDLLVSWGKLTVTLFTHAIDGKSAGYVGGKSAGYVGDKSAGYVGGLHENDFIVAARIDALLESEQPGGSPRAADSR